MIKKFVRMCPRYRSTNVIYGHSNAALVNTGMTSNSFVCKNCGNSIVFSEIQKE
ncbi:MAG: hypothetical protein QXJ28_02300 [Candidatus Pacearchaeota archaeon]